MNIEKVLFQLLLAIVVVLAPFTLQSEEMNQSQQPAQSVKTVADNDGKNAVRRLIKYLPPSSKHKGGESGMLLATSGGTRNASAASTPIAVLTLLSPNIGAPAFTIDEHPILYWHLSKKIDVPTVFTLLELDADEPLLEVHLANAAAAGFHSINLQDFNVRLQTDKIYEWSISLITDKINQIASMNDVVEKAFMKRIESNAKISAARSTDSLSRLNVYADNNLWYDSISLIFGEHPDQVENNSLQQARSELLKLSGLPFE